MRLVLVIFSNAGSALGSCCSPKILIAWFLSAQDLDSLRSKRAIATTSTFLDFFATLRIYAASSLKERLPSINVRFTNSATTGLLIPPSNVLIVYALASGGAASVAALFIAGYLPGVLLGLALIGYIVFVAIKRKFIRGQRATLKEVLIYFRQAFFSLLMLVIVVGGI